MAADIMATSTTKLTFIPLSIHLARSVYAPQSLATKLFGGAGEDTNTPVCFIIGAMAAGHITKDDHPYIQEMFSISNYQLSGAAAIARILGAIETHKGIV